MKGFFPPQMTLLAISESSNDNEAGINSALSTRLTLAKHHVRPFTGINSRCCSFQLPLGSAKHAVLAALDGLCRLPGSESLWDHEARVA